MKHPISSIEKSKCCNASVMAHISEEGTGFYQCTKCRKACDVSSQEKKCKKCGQSDLFDDGTINCRLICDHIYPSVSEQKECRCHCHKVFIETHLINCYCEVKSCPHCSISKGHIHHKNGEYAGLEKDCDECSISKEGDWKEQIYSYNRRMTNDARPEEIIGIEIEEVNYIKNLIASSLQEERANSEALLSVKEKRFEKRLQEERDALIKKLKDMELRPCKSKLCGHDTFKTDGALLHAHAVGFNEAINDFLTILLKK